VAEKSAEEWEAWHKRNEEICLVVRALARQLVAPDEIDWSLFTLDEQREIASLVRWQIRIDLEELRRQQRGPAQRRAQGLLRTLLSERQRQDLRRRCDFFVTTKAGNVYRLRPARGHIERVERHGNRWYAKTRYCLHDPETDPVKAPPPADTTIGHLLLLSCDEAAFLSMANATPVGDQLWNRDYLRRIREGRKRRDLELSNPQNIASEHASQSL
jgi:hypothetical protein